MATYTTSIAWERNAALFVDHRYSRAHQWRFDGGTVVPASSSPHIVPLPYSDPAAVDPEEAFVAALASCHMLWFLDVAARHGYLIASYRDQAEGLLARNAEGKLAMTAVTLRPHVVFEGSTVPTDENVRDLHHQAHENCFLARSVTSPIAVHPTWELA